MSARQLEAVAVACACCAAVGVALLEWRAVFFAAPSLLIAMRGDGGAS